MSGFLTNFVGTARQAHELLCLDTCTITRPSAGALNTTTGQYATTSATIYSGACRVDTLPGQDVVTTPLQYEAARHTLTLPWSAAASATIQPGDKVTVTSSDPLLTVRLLTVISEVLGSTASARRFMCETVQ